MDWQKASPSLSYRCLVCQSTSAVGLPFEQTPRVACKAQWGSQIVWVLEGHEKLHLHVPGTAMSLTKLFWRFLNNDKKERPPKILGYVKYSKISVFCATSCCKKTFLGYSSDDCDKAFDLNSFARPVTWWQSPGCWIMWVVSKAPCSQNCLLLFVHERITVITLHESEGHI